MSLALLVLVWTFTWQRLDAEKVLTRANASVQQQNLSHIISENLGQILDRGRVMAIAAEGWFNGNPAETLGHLSSMAAADRIFLRIALYDQTSRRVYTSSPAQDSPEFTTAVWALLSTSAQEGTNHLRLAPLSPSSEHAWQIPLLIPVNGNHNTPRGVLLVVLDLGYFLQLYRHIDMGRSGVIQVLTADAMVVAEARPEGLVLQNGARRAGVSLPPGVHAGALQGDLFQDGRTYLSSFRQPESRPFTVVVSRDMQEILTAHSAIRSRLFAGLAVLTAFFAAVTFWVARGIQRQGGLVEALARSNEKNQLLIDQLEEEKRRAVMLAAHDHLTGLPNRRMFNELLASHLLQAKRNRRHYALMYLDLDRFKSVNDTLGHHVGDLLLQAVSARLRAGLRESDLVARLGGDEFAVLVTGLERMDDIAAVAGKLVEQLSLPYEGLDGHAIQTSPSIGVAVFPRDGQDIGALSRHADAAMYQSKRSGRGRYTFYDAVRKPADARFLEQRLPKAIAEHELVLHFQPKVRLCDYQLVGFEALVRWQHPEFGLIYPNDFIPLAESTGAIVELGNWVAQACCQQLASWQAEGLKVVPIAFNVSAMQLLDEELPLRVAGMLATHGVAAGSLEVEITETCLVESMDVAVKVLDALEKLGVHIALDDFGSGFSSLGYVRTLPIHCIKIDRSFINDIRNSPDDAVIVTSIITLAHNLKMRVVAEGVERLDQLIHLKTAGCDEVQGYFFSRPVPADAAREFLLQPAMSPA
ncbi:hypothetical protein B2J86_12980 [Acidovorax sp. SRB_14]|nr:hypothetical protein [Acidovorax sp. SRB_14]